MRQVLLAACGGLLLAACPAGAQLFVDAGGPRDIFFGTGKIEDGLKGVHLAMDTSKKSLGASWLSSFERAPGWVVGGGLKATAVDGLEQFFRFDRWPKTEFNLLANKTFEHRINDEQSLFYSITIGSQAMYSEFGLFDSARPAGQQIYKDDFLGGDLHATLSVLCPNGADSFALTLGYRRDSNYEELHKTTVGEVASTFPGSGGSTIATLKNPQVVRTGRLETYNGVPITGLYSRKIEQFDRVVQWLPDWWLLGKLKESSYVLFLSPYISYLPRDAGKSLDSVGLNFVIRSYKAGKTPDKDKISFPVAVFVERQHTISGHPEMRAGAALIYHFK